MKGKQILIFNPSPKLRKVKSRKVSSKRSKCFKNSGMGSIDNLLLKTRNIQNELMIGPLSPKNINDIDFLLDRILYKLTPPTRNFK